MKIVLSLTLGLALADISPTITFRCLLELLLLLVLGCALYAMVGPPSKERRVRVGKQMDASGRSQVFTLSLDNETVTLDPGKPWTKVDVHKWVTRGIIAIPPSYHVLPNGAVDINGEKITLEEANGAARLEHEINKSFAAPVPQRAPPLPAAVPKSAVAGPEGSAPKVRFHVKQDHLGHVTIECTRRAEKAETGLRGLPSLIVNGFMLPAKEIHVDPLQRAIEIDGQRFECNETGVQQLEEVLNAKYAPELKGDDEGDISIKENPASPTGFDIYFVTVHSGMRLEIKGHLSQEKLDILQDHNKSGLLQHDIVLRLSPPNLLIRKKQPGGGEERIPELPDIPYRKIHAMELQRILNDPRVRKTAQPPGSAAAAAVPEKPPAQIREIGLTRNPQNRMLLWLECVMTEEGKIEGKALTHHNIADLQHRHVFAPHLDVTLSIDNQRLSILNKETHKEEVLQLRTDSSESDLARAGQMLTQALQPAVPKGVSAGSPATSPAT